MPDRPRARSRRERPSTASRAQRLAVAAAAVAEIAASWYVVRAGTDRFAHPAAGGDPPLIPAPYAFSIWGPIYGGMAAYALRAALARPSDRPLLRATAWPATAAMLGAAAWVTVAQEERRVWWTVAILAGMTVALARAHAALERHADDVRGVDRWLVRAPLGLYFGWCTAATFANLASALRSSGVTRPGAETLPTLLMLAGATAAASAVARWMRPNPWYAGAVTWALVAIAAADAVGVNRPRNAAVAAAAGAGALAVLASLLLPRPRRKPRRAAPEV